MILKFKEIAAISIVVWLFLFAKADVAETWFLMIIVGSWLIPLTFMAVYFISIAISDQIVMKHKNNNFRIFISVTSFTLGLSIIPALYVWSDFNQVVSVFETSLWTALPWILAGSAIYVMASIIVLLPLGPSVGIVS